MCYIWAVCTFDWSACFNTQMAFDYSWDSGDVQLQLAIFTCPCTQRFIYQSAHQGKSLCYTSQHCYPVWHRTSLIWRYCDLQKKFTCKTLKKQFFKRYCGQVISEIISWSCNYLKYEPICSLRFFTILHAYILLSFLDFCFISEIWNIHLWTPKYHSRLLLRLQWT